MVVEMHLKAAIEAVCPLLTSGSAVQHYLGLFYYVHPRMSPGIIDYLYESKEFDIAAVIWPRLIPFSAFLSVLITMQGHTWHIAALISVGINEEPTANQEYLSTLP